MNNLENAEIINSGEISAALENAENTDSVKVREILEKARELKGLDFQDISHLMALNDPELEHELFATASQVKQEIYGKRIVMFAPLYISNLCNNDCIYCSFRVHNKEIKRRTLKIAEVVQETKALIDQGHKRLLMVSGEQLPETGFDYILDSIRAIYETKSGNGEIRRVNVNLAPVNVEKFKLLKQADIGTFQSFQETYHRPTYKEVHLLGKKSDYNWRLTAMDRAMQAGIDDLGIGILYGLYDWKYETLALMQHIRHLERNFGVGPHTISVPRLEPAVGADFSTKSQYLVDDHDFKKIVAILRIAVPYTGLILSTRENPEIRRDVMSLGVSQISAGSRTEPGSYSGIEKYDEPGQFQLGDHRSLKTVINELLEMGFLPSFCTACYRLGRTGMDFMDLAIPGEIKNHCNPNALSTLMEYALDYGDEKTRDLAVRAIKDERDNMNDKQKAIADTLVENVKQGRRDQFC